MRRRRREMTDRIQRLLDYFIVNKSHHALRQPAEDAGAPARMWKERGLSLERRAVERLRWTLERERPVVFPDERIAIVRTVPAIPEILTGEEEAALRIGHHIHERGKVCNVNPLYSALIDEGFDHKRAQIEDSLAGFEAKGDARAIEFLQCCLQTLDAVEIFADRCRAEAARVGNKAVEEAFSNIPRRPPRSFAEALQFFRLIHFCLWASFNYHNTVGRFDQYMLPFYRRDIQSGALDKEGALELLEEFFLSFNKDSDLYPGMQQGDNGQSMVLGGTLPGGGDGYNELSDLCLQASLELRLIDPKINLRVGSSTPLSLYERGTLLTRQGLGFPQYSNDDIVIKALERWGYRKEDAENYVVAACWEFIIPGAGMDIPNINGLSFPLAVVRMLEGLEGLESFDDCMEAVHRNIQEEAGRLCQDTGGILMEPAPLLSMMMDGCVPSGRDISLGGVYNNYGIHGSGLSTAVDSLAALKRFVFDEKALSKKALLELLERDWKDDGGLWARMRNAHEKMGNDEDWVDAIAARLLGWFADALEGRRNDRGGIFRPGTGSAMYYIWQSKDLQATPDGRRRGEEFACNYSPSLLARCDGPFSIIKSFTKPDLVRVCNGGPLTIELSDSLFRNEDSIRKVAMFVRTFIRLGGHQLQLNAVNREELLDAKRHPERHRNLIVRVWGWSGHFVELDEAYQNQIIKRTELEL